MLSVVIPVMNEEDNIAPMLSGLGEALKSLKHEIIFVDDGSSDDTIKNIVKAKQSNVRLLEFARNYGQTSAMAAGIEAALGDYVVTLDGDLQNDPSDIPVMLEKLKKENKELLQ